MFAPSPGVRRAVRDAAAALRSAGATVVSWKIPDPGEAQALFFGLLGADGGAGLKRLLRGSRKDVRVAQLLFMGGRSAPTRSALIALARIFGQGHLAAVLQSLRGGNVDDYWRLCERQIDYRTRFAKMMDASDAGALDLLLGPPVATPAFTHGATKDMGLPGIYTTLYNVLGYPGIFRGALMAGASQITTDMKLAAAWALAGLTIESELVPDPLDRSVHDAVAEAVRVTAVQAGLGDPERVPPALAP